MQYTADVRIIRIMCTGRVDPTMVAEAFIQGADGLMFVGCHFGDCHYITRYMPDELPGKVVVTNTTTPADVELLKRAGVKYLVTSTPVLDGRSFGTNMMEAALIAASGRKIPVDYARASAYFKEVEGYLEELKTEPQLRELN